MNRKSGKNYLISYNSWNAAFFQEWRESANPFCEKLLLRFSHESRELLSLIQASDILVNIPSTRSLQNRYLPTSLENFSRQLSLLCQIPFISHALQKTQPRRQHSLPAKERIDSPLFLQTNPQRLSQIRRRRILLIDDIFTTGTSLLQAEFLLYQCQAAQVSSFTLGRAFTERA